MKKFFAISMLFVYLFSTTEMHQLVKLPFLLEHFKEHQQNNKSLSFFDFLEIHYFNEGSNHQKSHEKSNLPFKNFQDNHPNFVFNLPNNIDAFVSKPTLPNFFQKSAFSYQINITSKFKISIWQPPKIC